MEQELVKTYREACRLILKDKKVFEFPLTNLWEEWNYVTGDSSVYVDLLHRLDQNQLLLEENRICDCGIGLGETMFNLYLQSKEIKNREFHFFGIEKNKFLFESFNNKLNHFWNDIEVINEDIMNCNYANFTLVHTYTPFKSEKKLVELYSKILQEISIDGILIENMNKGLGLKSCLYNLAKDDGRISILDLDGLKIYKKVN